MPERISATKGAAETLSGNCDGWIFFGGNEAFTTKTISDRLGYQTIDVIETSETKDMNGFLKP